MADEPTQLHYRADQADVYAEALLRAVRHARKSTEDFTFGPLKLADCERDGLVIGGPDLAGITAVLATVPGLAQVDL